MARVVRQGRRITLRLLWALILGLPLLAITFEVWLALAWQVTLRGAEGRRLRSPNVSDVDGPANRRTQSLWAIPWRQYRPNAFLDLPVGRDHFVVRINSQGFRGPEFSVTKPTGTFRIVCVGGSTTFQGRSNEETYPALLERRLQAKYPQLKIEVLNLGISGLTSDYWLERSAYLFRLQPDVVLQYEGVNDIAWRALPTFAMKNPWLRKAHASFLLQHLLPVEPEELDPYFSVTVENQVRLADLSRQHGAVHFAGSFAGPDYERAPRDFQQYLDVNVAAWTSNSARLSGYRAYARLLDRYNRSFEQARASGRVRGPLVHRQLGDPGLFVDLCHLTQAGLLRLAEAFVPAVSAAIESRPASSPATPGGS